MIGLGAGQVLIAKAAEGDTPARILDPRPGQCGVQIVTAIEKDRAGLNLAGYGVGRRRILAPDRRR
jgi:hypothetical protein